VCEGGSVRVRCHDPSHDEAARPSLRTFHTASPRTRLNKLPGRYPQAVGLPRSPRELYTPPYHHRNRNGRSMSVMPLSIAPVHSSSNSA
jgi:hypothetical protein